MNSRPVKRKKNSDSANSSVSGAQRDTAPELFDKNANFQISNSPLAAAVETTPFYLKQQSDYIPDSVLSNTITAFIF